MAISMDDYLGIWADESTNEIVELLKDYSFGLKVEIELTECLSNNIIFRKVRRLNQYRRRIIWVREEGF
jgi:hypothetical protein